ncbi:MAG: right-handed parallel beta-helix repeat-containing protein [Planctomycetota bacterium]|jgi:hypothetical protein
MASGETIYVNDDAGGANNGTSWDDAYKSLQSALIAARSGDQIWVAAGTYKPGNSRLDSFQMKDGVTIKGGYAGFGAPDPNERGVGLYETILSGDLDGNDITGLDHCDLLNHPSRSENSYHVVTGSGTDSTAVLDGFTITGGNANGTEPHHHRHGSGMYNYIGSPTVTNCTFIGNSAWGGGGMHNRESSPTVTNCTFSGNSALVPGGGMANHLSNSTLTNCTFSRNWAYCGSGMCNSWGSNATLTNCTFSGNLATGYGGGMLNYSSGSTVTNCTFSGNSAGNYGGGMFNHVASTTLTNCTFASNSGSVGGGMYNYDGNLTVSNCTFSGNSSRYSGGGMYNDYSGPTLTNCTFTGNSANGNGGGMYNNLNSNLTVTNCILWRNTATNGAQIAQVSNCTLSISYSDAQGGWEAVYSVGSSILWGAGNIDADPCFVDAGYRDANATPEDANDDFWVDGDYHLLPGSPCIDAADNNSVPADTADLDGDGNTDEPTPWDLDSHPRIIDGDCSDTVIVDMGPYEFAWAYIGDFDGQCDVDFADFAVFGLTWLSEDGEPQYNPACDISIPADNYIDWFDLAVLSDNWLEEE